MKRFFWISLITMQMLHAMDNKGAIDEEARRRIHNFLYAIGFVGKTGRLSDAIIHDFKCGQDLHLLAQNLVTQAQLEMLKPLLKSFVHKTEYAQEAYAIYTNHFNISPQDKFKVYIKANECYAQGHNAFLNDSTRFISHHVANDLLPIIVDGRSKVLEALIKNTTIPEGASLFFKGALVSLSVKEIKPSRVSASDRKEKRRSLPADALHALKATSSYIQTIKDKRISPPPTRASLSVPIIPTIIEHTVTLFIPNTNAVVTKALVSRLSSADKASC